MFSTISGVEPKYYPRAAQAPHSETGRPVDISHVWRTDFVTVKNAIKDYLGIKRSKYNNSFGFVNEKILSCHNIHELVSHQEPCKDGIFDIKEWGDVGGFIVASRNGNGTALKLLKGIIQVSLLNELFFCGKSRCILGNNCLGMEMMAALAYCI